MGKIMKPGRELDLLVSEKVMGINPRELEQIPGDWRVKFRGCPNYSTDIAAAWGVVETLRSNGKHLDLSGCTSWEARFTGLTEPVEGETAPHAICLAALKAIGS